MGLIYQGVGALPGSMSDPRAIYQVGSDGLNIGSLYKDAGSAVPLYVTRNGHGVRRFACGSAQNTTAALYYSLPLGRPLVQIPVTMRRQFRMVWETVIERTSALIAGAGLEIGLKDDIIDLATANGGAVLSSVSTQNAGRWTLRYKLVNGGAEQAPIDTGFAVGTGILHHLRLEYLDQLTPTLNFFINGVLVGSLSGATLPAFDGNEPANPSIVQFSPTIGQLDHQYGSRFYIEEL